MATFAVKPDIEEARRHIEAWWAGSSVGGRPAVAHSRIAKCGAPPAPADDRPREVRELDPVWQVRSAEWALAAHDFPAETMPGIITDYANLLVLPAVLVGGRLEYRPDTTWIHLMEGVYDRPLPDFSTSHPVFRKLDAILRAFGESLGDRGLLTPPALLDGMTTLSMFRGPEQLCLDLIERPADVKRVSARLDRIAFDAHRAFRATLKEFGHDQTVTWAGIYSPGTCEMVQCDFAIMISPEMFGQFVMPNLRAATEYFDRSCYHLDGTPQCRFLDQLCALPRLNAIQWNPEPGVPGPLRWVDFFRAVRKRGRSLWVVCQTPEEAVELTRQLGPDGLMLAVRGVNSPADMDCLLKRLKT